MKNNNYTITTKKLAELCNVSSGTVDRALNNRGRIREETRNRILEKAKEYGYLEQSAQKPKLIGLIVFDLYNEFFSELVMDLESECSAMGYSLVVMFTNKDTQREIDCINQLYFMGVCGIILCPVNNDATFTRFLNSLGKPVVTIGNTLDGIGHIGIDDYQAGYDAARYLSQKSKRILYYSPALNSQNNHTAQRERYRGFMAYCTENAILLNQVSETKEVAHWMESGRWAIAVSSDCYLTEILGRYPEADVIGFDNLRSLSVFPRMVPSVDCNIRRIAELTIKNIDTGSNESIVVPHCIEISGKHGN